MLNITVQATRQELAEDAVEGFRKNLGPFVVAAETTRAAMVFTNAMDNGNPIVFVNDAFLALTGYAREELLGRPFLFLLDRGMNDAARAYVAAAFVGESHEELELSDRRKDGSLFWASIWINPVYDECGRVVQHFASFIDISRPKREAKHLRFLLDELNHRTQNTLASVLAIAAQTLRGQADGSVVEAYEGRVLALSKAHGLLGRDNWEAVKLHDVLSRILQPFGLNDETGARFRLEGEDVRLNPKAALTLALVFHELAGNASKFGALSTAEGCVEIGWRIEHAPTGGRMFLRWQERGGPPVAPPSRKGFGSRLIERGLAQDIDGEVRLTYEALGLVCQVVMPLDPPAAS